MEPNASVCTTCHQPILPEYYFCPNCGTKIKQAPLSTTVSAQLGLYAFSIVLPMICFLFVTRWKGMQYFKSQNPKEKQIGQIAWALVVLSTVFTIWFVIVSTQNYIKSVQDSINADFNF